MIVFFIVKKTIEHLQLTFLSVIIAMLFATPLGVFLANCKKKKVASFFIKLSCLLQSIPPLASMALIIVMLILINEVFKVPVTGVFTGIFVLAVYAFLIILNYSFSARKIEKQNLSKFKISVFILLKGIKKAVVSTVGMATLVSLIGSGGLGDLIMQGLKNLNIMLIISGSLPAAFLGISLDLLIEHITKKLRKKVP